MRTWRCRWKAAGPATRRGAVCTQDGRGLSGTVSLTLPGPGSGTTLWELEVEPVGLADVVVTLASDRACDVAGAVCTKGGEPLSATVSLTVRGPVAVADARVEEAAGATGTIENDDPMPAARLVRFGRTVGTQVVEAVTVRLEKGGESHVTVGGQRVATGGAATEELEKREAQARLKAMSEWLRGKGAGDGRTKTRTMTEREFLLGSSFHLATGNEGGGPSVAAWGRVATGRFDGDVDKVRLDGEVTTGLLGADVESGRWLAGAALSHSRGEGGYALGSGVESAFGKGDVESTLTSVFPYARVNLGGRASAWALAGYGTGELTLSNESESETTRYKTDIALRMGAAGAQGTLLAPAAAGGFRLGVKLDAFLVRMTSDKIKGKDGMEASEADASRLRLILRGSRSFAVGGGTLTPSVELGLRHDGGDAETGTGVEAGAGIRYSGGDITVEGRVRGLIAHEEMGYEEWGASGSVRIDPGADGRGLSLTLTPVWGNASSGTGRLWSLADTRSLADNEEFEPGTRFDAEVGYGFGGPRGLGTVTPYAGLSLSKGSERKWRAGARWQVAPAFSLSLEGTRREPAGDNAPEHGVTLGVEVRW